MKKTKKGSAAPQKQQTLEDQYECYTVDSMPQNVKTRSKGAVTCENDITKVVKTMMEGEVLNTPEWCKNRCNTLSGCALLVDSDIFLDHDKLEMMEKLTNGDVAVKAMGYDIWSANYQQEPIDIKGRLYPRFKTYSQVPEKFKRIC